MITINSTIMTSASSNNTHEDRANLRLSVCQYLRLCSYIHARSLEIRHDDSGIQELPVHSSQIYRFNHNDLSIFFKSHPKMCSNLAFKITISRIRPNGHRLPLTSGDTLGIPSRVAYCPEASVERIMCSCKLVSSFRILQSCAGIGQV